MIKIIYFQGTTVDMCFTCLSRETGAVLKAAKPGTISINCKEDKSGIDVKTSNCVFDK